MGDVDQVDAEAVVGAEQVMSTRRSTSTAQLRRDAAGVLLPGFVGTALPAALAAQLQAGLAGVVLFGMNVGSPDQLRTLTDAVLSLRPDAIVAIDEEGGDVTRLHVADGSPHPGNAVLGRIDDESATTASARAIGLELAAAGCTLALAPSVDVNSNPDNPVIGTRSFGSDAHLAARHAAAWTRGLQSAGVAACAKHFPGHGDTAADSHLGLPVVELDLDALRRRELVPFVAAISAGVATVMTSHILLPRLDPAAPATMSRRVLTGLLREELGFDGVIVTDALDMAGASAGIGIPAAAVRALAAGADLLCLGRASEPHLDAVQVAIVAAVQRGELSADRLHDAATRVRALAVSRTAPAPESRASTSMTTSMTSTSTPLEPTHAASAAGEGLLDAASLVAAFEVTATAAAALARTREWTVVRLDAEPNIAVGLGGWGPFSAGAAVDARAAARRFARWRRVDVDADRPGPLPRVDGPVVVIGRDIHRHPHGRAVVDGLRAQGGAMVVVEMGWPSADRRYADIATFGGSAAVGAALLGLLTGALPPGSAEPAAPAPPVGADPHATPSTSRAAA